MVLETYLKKRKRKLKDLRSGDLGHMGPLLGL